MPQTPPMADLVQELQAQNQKLTENYHAALIHAAHSESVLLQQIRKLTSAKKKLSEDSKSSRLAAQNWKLKCEQLMVAIKDLQGKVSQLEAENKVFQLGAPSFGCIHEVHQHVCHEVKGVASSSGQQGKRKLEPKPPALPPPLSCFQPGLVAKNAKAKGKSESKGKCNGAKGEGKGKSEGQGTRVAKRLTIGMSSGECTGVAKGLPIATGLPMSSVEGKGKVSSSKHKNHKGK